MLFIKIFFFFFLIFLGVNSVGTAQGINFSETSISNLKKGSKATNKPYLIYLFADECNDCKQVEKLTFTDPAVSSVINNNLLAGRVNLRSEGGQKLKEKYKIDLAPVFLFYNKKGKLLLQQETAMSSSSLLKIVKVLYGLDINLSIAKRSTDRFDNFEDFEVSTPEKLMVGDKLSRSAVDLINERQVAPPRTSAMFTIKAAQVPELDNKILNAARSNRLKSPQQLFDPNSATVSYSPDVKYKEGSFIVIKENSKSKNVSTKTKEAKPRLISGDVLYKKIISTPTSSKIVTNREVIKTVNKATDVKHKSIQFAAYNKYDDVLKGMYKMKRKIENQLTIIEEYTKGRLMYKLIIDEKMTPLKAQELKSKFQQRGIDCFVRTSP